MRNLALVAFLAILQLTASVVILQSSIASTKIIAPIFSTTSVSVPFNTAYPNIAGVGVQWITGSAVYPVSYLSTTFRSQFYASCTGMAKLKILASIKFQAFLDGISIAKGSLSEEINQQGFPVMIKCGSHELTVKVDGDIASQEALTFSLDQDQSACFKCGSTGFWNDITCRCDCINRLDKLNKCGCPTPMFWRDFPTCGCVCPTKLCLPPRYFDPTLCQCACKPTYCPPKEYFDKLQCACIPQPN